MYTHNTKESTARVRYYKVSGVPDFYPLGKRANATQTLVDEQIGYGSPIKITVHQVDLGSTRNVIVMVSSLGIPPKGDFRLRTAIVETDISYGSAPGSNGEKSFPNVFRKMLPDTLGDLITSLPAKGDSVKFNYSFDENSSWDMAKIELIAFIQSDLTKEVINCGSTFDSNTGISLYQPESHAKDAGTSGAQSFEFNLGNSSSVSETYNYTLSSKSPSDWSAGFTINNAPYTSSAEISINANTIYPAKINITPGAKPGLGVYTLKMKSTTNPSAPYMVATVYILSNVSDLIISNSGYSGNGNGGNASQWQADFANGLFSAGRSSFDTTNEKVFSILFNEHVLDKTKNFYYNVGWTFTCFTDTLVTQLSSILDNGGHLFISGQDIGWDTWDATAGTSAAGTNKTKAFYTNYLNAKFIGDGTSANNSINATAQDPVFGQAPMATISNYYGNDSQGKPYLYPDEISPLGIGTTIFKYNGGSKVAGVRSFNGVYKVVYLAVGLEMLENATIKNQILKLSHDWFYSIVGTEEFDREMLSIGQNFPNPGINETSIPFKNVDHDMMLQLNDIAGRTLAEYPVIKGTTSITINTSAIQSGLYLYRLMYKNFVLPGNLMQVIH